MNFKVIIQTSFHFGRVWIGGAKVYKIFKIHNVTNSYPISMLILSHNFMNLSDHSLFFAPNVILFCIWVKYNHRTPSKICYSNNFVLFLFDLVKNWNSQPPKVFELADGRFVKKQLGDSFNWWLVFMVWSCLSVVETDRWYKLLNAHFPWKRTKSF